jgi:hypothetical protein|tara:strand:- start:8841 stop:9077 length:237 start_codon:yes stop_codon:yes gene_type:complete
MKEKKEYRIDEKKYKEKTYMHDGKAEVLLSLFVERLCEIRPNLKWGKVCKEIAEKYLTKKENSQFNPTQIMRHAINKK